MFTTKTPQALFAVSLSALLLMASAVQAQTAEPKPSGRGAQAFTELDVNKDGYLDKTEVVKRERLAKNFDQLDADKDQRLSPTELQAARTMASKRRGSANAPGDSAQ
jgi:Ca2+-binding EF-hand superfamily protein